MWLGGKADEGVGAGQLQGGEEGPLFKPSYVLSVILRARELQAGLWLGRESGRGVSTLPWCGLGKGLETVKCASCPANRSS